MKQALETRHYEFNWRRDQNELVILGPNAFINPWVEAQQRVGLTVPTPAKDR